MDTVGERVKSRRKELKLSADEVAKKMGKNRATIYRYESDDIENMSIEVISELAKVLKTDPSYLMGWKENKEDLVSKTEYYYLPTTISAGLPLNVEAITNADKISIPDSMMGKWAGNKNIFITKVNGDSMDKVIPDGSLIAVKPITLDCLKNGDMVVFSNDNHDYSVKYYHKINDRLIFKPASYNADHHEQHYNINDNVTIHGKVVMYLVELD